MEHMEILWAFHQLKFGKLSVVFREKTHWKKRDLTDLTIKQADIIGNIWRF